MTLPQNHLTVEMTRKTYELWLRALGKLRSARLELQDAQLQNTEFDVAQDGRCGQTARKSGPSSGTRLNSTTKRSTPANTARAPGGAAPAALPGAAGTASPAGHSPGAPGPSLPDRRAPAGPKLLTM